MQTLYDTNHAQTHMKRKPLELLKPKMYMKFYFQIPG